MSLWAAVPVAASLLSGLNGREAVQSVDPDPVLKVEWRVQKYSAETGIASFTGGVKATYGETVLYSDDLELNYKTKQGRALGKVRLVDPEGELEAEQLLFDWGAGTGRAENVLVTAYGATAKAKSVEVMPDRWILYDLYATPSPRETPDIAFGSSKVILRTGRNARTFKPTLYLFGRKIGPGPTYTFSLDKRVQGLRIPAVSFRQGEGLGVTWVSGFLVNDRTSVSAELSSFPKSLPVGKISLAWSSVPPTRSTGYIEPFSELPERFYQSHLESVNVEEPEEEEESIGRPRATVALSTSWNQSTSARRVDSDRVTKPVELTGEMSDRLSGGGGWFLQARAQRVRPDIGQPVVSRLVGIGTIISRPLPVAKNLDLRLRLDAQTFLTQNQGQFGWVRGNAGLAWRPHPKVVLSGGYNAGREFGTAALVYDRLYATEGVNLRSDFFVGPIKASALVKYDVNYRRWYDTEFGVYWAAGSFEPFLVSRQFPKEYRLGVRFRFTSLVDRLSSRSNKRRSQTKTERP